VNNNNLNRNLPQKSMKIQNFLLVGFCLMTVMLSGCNTPTPQTPASSAASNTSSPKASTLPPANVAYDTASASEPPKAANDDKFPGLPRLKGKATVTMVIKDKPVVLELDGENAPITAGNFVDLVDQGFYNGLTFHRVIKDFVAQGGDPQGNGTGGYVPKGKGQERRIPLEIKLKGSPEPTYSQVFEDVQSGGQVPVLVHKRGVLSMARSQSPDSASSQFYVTLADVNFLDGKYAVFGKVVKGMEVIDSIKIGDKITSAKVTARADAKSPAAKPGSSKPSTSPKPVKK
jgi:peptidyl-prolyl cis-trans isomerase B (cyclophilin B)